MREWITSHVDLVIDIGIVIILIVAFTGYGIVIERRKAQARKEGKPEPRFRTRIW